IGAADAAGVSWTLVDAPLDWLAGGAAAVAAGRAAIADAAQNWGADLVQVNQPAYAGGDHPAPVVAVAHSCVETWWRGTHGRPAPAEWAWHARAVGEGLRAASVVVAPSRSFAAMLQRTYGLGQPPVAVLNGIRPGAGPAEKGAFVLASGRVWDPSKNFALLDAAAPAIHWPVQVAGDRTAPDGTGALLPRHLRCLGQLSPRAMAAQYAAAPVYVSPSLCEPFGLGVLEAAQAGAALVLSDIDTFRELWDGAGLFFDRRDPAALAAAVNRLIDEPVLRQRMAAAACRRVARYSIAATAERMREVYALAAPERARVSA
ncbi:MAG TPA: glycosyltransferase family 4 protein, partial [Paracoccaceae bacterium]|nr:glycosyltransferase family 4 protein [Paracoccaceae bacterium]